MPCRRRQLDLPGVPSRVPKKRRRRSGRLCDAGAFGFREYECQRCGQEYVVWVSEAEDAQDRLITTRPCPDCDPEVPVIEQPGGAR